MPMGIWWTTTEMRELVEYREKGMKFLTIAKKMGRSKNSVVSAWNNRNRYVWFSWEEIKRIVHEDHHYV